MGHHFIEYRLNYFQFPFKRPIKIGDKTLSKRCGYHLTLTDNYGKSAIGELAPLEGLHQYSLNKAKDELERVLPAFLNRPINTEKLDLSCPWFNIIDPSKKALLKSSTTFCIEHALLNYCNVISGKAAPYNGLIIPQGQLHMQNCFDRWKKNSINTVKIKIGRNSIDEDIKLINKITHHYQGKIRLRLDGNRQFGVTNLLKLVSAIDHSTIEYLEEPLENTDDWPLFYQKTKLPLALDDSLPKFLPLFNFPTGTKAWVIKPTLLGGIVQGLKLINMAQRLGFYCVISSTFDSPIALKALHYLASVQNKIRPTPCGLDIENLIITG